MSRTAPAGRRTRVMRPWDWSLPPRPVSHREVVSAQPTTPAGRPQAALTTTRPLSGLTGSSE